MRHKKKKRLERKVNEDQIQRNWLDTEQSFFIQQLQERKKEKEIKRSQIFDLRH